MDRLVRLADPAQRQTKRFLFIQIMSHSLLLPVYHAFAPHLKFHLGPHKPPITLLRKPPSPPPPAVDDEDEELEVIVLRVADEVELVVLWVVYNVLQVPPTSSTIGAPKSPTLAPIPQEPIVTPSGTVTTGTVGAESEGGVLLPPPRVRPKLPVSVPPMEVVCV
jgi:hypothetical protein